MERLKKVGLLVFSVAISAIGVAIYIYLTAEVITLPPDNAKIIVDNEHQTFASIPCVVRGMTDREFLLDRSQMDDLVQPLILASFANEGTIADIKAGRDAGAKWRRDARCNASNGFDQRNAPENLDDPKRRWTIDGDWRW